MTMALKEEEKNEKKSVDLVLAPLSPLPLFLDYYNSYLVPTPLSPLRLNIRPFAFSSSH